MTLLLPYVPGAFCIACHFASAAAFSFMVRRVRNGKGDGEDRRCSHLGMLSNTELYALMHVRDTKYQLRRRGYVCEVDKSLGNPGRCPLGRPARGSGARGSQRGSWG